MFIFFLNCDYIKLFVLEPVTFFDKQKKLICVDGYTFHRQKNLVSGRRWHCSSYSKKCKAYVITDFSENIIIKKVSIHTHEPPKLLC